MKKLLILVMLFSPCVGYLEAKKCYDRYGYRCAHQKKHRHHIHKRSRYFYTYYGSPRYTMFPEIYSNPNSAWATWYVTPGKIYFGIPGFAS